MATATNPLSVQSLAPFKLQSSNGRIIEIDSKFEHAFEFKPDHGEAFTLIPGNEAPLLVEVEKECWREVSFFRLRPDGILDITGATAAKQEDIDLMLAARTALEGEL
jgi:hypothetical protein